VAAQSRAGVRVEGLAELRTAFRRAGSEMDKDLDAALKSAAEPVRTTGQGLLRSRIKRGKIDWSALRVGITRHTVYVAPAKRRTVGSRRRNLAPVIQEEALNPALEQNVQRVEAEVKDAVRDMGRSWGRL